jgi:hypothetical protein
MNNEWVIGIITGFTSSTLIFLFTFLINKLVIPRVYGVLQRVPDISGSWELYDADYEDSCPVGHADVVQRGSDIKARVVQNLGRDGLCSHRAFL